ncbi:hypothetical protein K2173_001327 [Erythroxylum novogranatense]|uniref:BHLH domain-containing protein n=1 Tax=Erythroxylum novogranatense TaxID=1862640 RepID=A0AAV8T3F2_9ROSI|nr:hypothetical protein K2173_001327 [Erythroxylum novogranatense]
MALTQDRVVSVQTCAYNGDLIEDLPPLGAYGFGELHKGELEGDDNNFEKTNGLIIKNLAMSQSSSSLGSPSSANSNELVFQATNNPTEEAQSLINFRHGYDGLMHVNGSLLSFERKKSVSQGSSRGDYCQNWEDDLNGNNRWKHMNPTCGSDPRMTANFNSIQRASSYNSISNPESENSRGWLYLYPEGTKGSDSIQEFGTQDSTFHKRHNTGESAQTLKKQCNNATKKPKSKTVPSKDPQSIAAKVRRERISERLKILQELVPNGSKVDLVTMLEKAISYVKFLQLQVKVLATDEFWPAHGGKAPDISQVKEAIDAILSSQKDKNSSSSPYRK